MVKKIVKLIYKIIELKKISNEPELAEIKKQLYKLLNKELNRKNKGIPNDNERFIQQVIWDYNHSRYNG